MTNNRQQPNPVSKSRSRSMSAGSASSSGTGVGRSPKRQRVDDSEDEVEEVGASTEEIAGTILQIKLQDFMCHSKFEWRPKECANFIIGANGSGKSSILEAIVLGLCGVAKNVGRYTKLEGFVKKDCPKAVIEITLSNVGEDAYRPDFYGESITFKRIIYNSPRNNTMAILGHDKVARKVGQAKAETNHILDAFKIFINNPFIILHQDTAKEFLNVEKPEKLYQFFMEGTMLDEIQKNYGKADEDVADAERKTKKKEPEIRKLRENVEKIADDIKLIRQYSQDNKELIETERLLAWADVFKTSDELDNLKERKAKVEETAEQEKQGLNGVFEKNREVVDHLTEINKAIESENMKHHKEDETRRVLLVERERLKTKQKELDLRNKEVDREQRELEKQIQAKRTALAKHTDQASVDQKRREREELMREEKRIDEKIEDARERVNMESSKMTQLKEEVKLKEMSKVHLSREMNELAAQLEREQRMLNDIDNSNGMRLALFGKFARLLDQRVKANRDRFKELPVGPVGLYVKLAPGFSNQYRDLLETHIGQYSLRSYLVDNHNDRRQLQAIINQIKHEEENLRFFGPNLTVSRFLDMKHCDRKSFRTPNTRFRIAIDCLEVSNIQVYNYLIDNHGLESTVICETQQDAKEITTHRENVPSYLRLAITLDFNKFCPPGPNSTYRSYWIKELETNTRLIATGQEDPERQKLEEIAKLKAKQEKLNQHAASLLQFLKQFSFNMRQLQESFEQAKQELSTSRMDKSRVKQKLHKLEEEVQPLQLEAQISELEEQINKVNAEKLSLSTSLEEISMQSKAAEDKNKKLTELLRKARDENTRLRELEEQKRSLSVDKAGLDKTIRKMNMVLTKHRKTLDDLNSKIRVKNKRLQDETGKAEKSNGCTVPHRNEIGDPKRLRAKMKELGRKLDKAMTFLEQARMQDKVKEFTEKKERLKKLEIQMKDMDTHIQNLKLQSLMRKAKLLWIKNMVLSNCKRSFSMYSKRYKAQLGAEASLRITDQRLTIAFFITESNGEEVEVKKDLATLSGGEKSYLQMCLILSMWDSIISPIRGLDEWDVYLDHVNRKKMSLELLKTALMKEGVQTIFISPQGATNLSSSLSRSEIEKVEIREILKE